MVPKRGLQPKTTGKVNLLPASINKVRNSTIVMDEFQIYNRVQEKQDETKNSQKFGFVPVNQGENVC